jgi:hypothetical protein
MRLVLRWCVVLLLAASSLAQTAPAKKKTTTKTAATGTVSAADVQALKDALAAQQQQIHELKVEMQRRDAALQQAQQQMQDAQSAAAAAQAKADQAAQ